MKYQMNSRPWREYAWPVSPHNQATASPSVRILFSAGIGCSLWLMAQPALADSYGHADDLYQNSFSKPEAFTDDESFRPSEESPETENAILTDEPESASDIVSLNSFPLRIQVDGSDINGWNDDIGMNIPDPFHKAFKVSACHFEVVSGAFSVRRYSVGPTSDFAVEADAVMPESTFSLGTGETILFAVTTSLGVRVAPGNREECKKTFSRRTYSIGKARLAGSQLSAKNASGEKVVATKVRSDLKTKVYITWDHEQHRLVLVDRIGMTPELESGVFAMKFGSPTSFYLTFKPGFSLGHDKGNSVAKK